MIVRAPVRISFAGGGSDLAAYYERFGGEVLSAAITRYCYVVVERPADASIRINSADYRLFERFAPGETLLVEGPLVLPKAAIERFTSHGLREMGVDLFMAAEVPPGSGLGSSSAMAVALGHALAAYTGRRIQPVEAAELACELEIERLGMPIGKQDQYASAFGGLNTIEFRSSGVTVRPLALPPDVEVALCARLLLFSTGQTRHSATILRQQQADTRTKAGVVVSLHRMKALAAEMRVALEAGELDRFGQLLHSGWMEKRALSARVSTAEIDYWYEAARSAGALGGKIAGAGGGGFLLLYCPLRAQPALRAAMGEFGLRELAFDFDTQGARVLAIIDRPAEQRRQEEIGDWRVEIGGTASTQSPTPDL